MAIIIINIITVILGIGWVINRENLEAKWKGYNNYHIIKPLMWLMWLVIMALSVKSLLGHL